MQNVLRAREVIRGQLHHEGSGVAGEHLGLLQNDTAGHDGRHTDEVRRGRNPGAAAEHSRSDQADDGHLRTAGDEGGGHDGHLAVQRRSQWYGKP